MTDDKAGLPDWRTVVAGTKVRVALWLVSEVGEGGTFHIQDLRAAMPGVEQIARRMRDLRPAGWELETYRENPRLRPDELKLARIGDLVWQQDYRPAKSRITNRTRLQVMERDGFRCIRCGTGAGEPYPDDASSVARLTVLLTVERGSSDDRDTASLVTECRRCSDPMTSARSPGITAAGVRRAIGDLSEPDRSVVLGWILQNRREPSPTERVYLAFRQLGGADRTDIKAELEASANRPIAVRDANR